MNATTCFDLTEMGRTTINGIDWVLYFDGALADAVEAEQYDNVPEGTTATDYSDWCSGTTTADQETLGLILHALEIPSVNSGAHGHGVEARSFLCDMLSDADEATVRFSVRVPFERAPLVDVPYGTAADGRILTREERDFGSVKWSSDDEIQAVIADMLDADVAVRFLDVGDSPTMPEAIYEARRV